MKVFFYGLFMDESILMKNGVESSNSRLGYLQDYALKIGNRASLIPSEGERAYGIVMTVHQAAIEKLYAEESVSDYVPESVKVITEAKELIATCYNLPLSLLTGTNRSYATSLYNLATQIGFPDAYLEHIKKMMEE